MIRRLITDDDVLRGRVRSPIVLDEGTLLTPAARDRARLAGIEIVERGGTAGTPSAAPGQGARTGTSACPRCGGAGCGPTCSATCGGGAPSGARLPEALADGLYLVRVEDGRAVSVLAAAGPGQMTPARRDGRP